MDPFTVILRPILSEKTNDLREEAGKYSFQVVTKATKSDVRAAVTKLWNVKVKSVRTMIKREKIKRKGRQLSKPGTFKKAIVTLADGAKLPLFDDQ